MTDAQAIIGLITAAAGGIGVFLRWALALWATVRREEMCAAKEAAALVREDTRERTAALIEQAKANVALAERIDELGGKLDTVLARWDGPTSEHRRRAARDTEQDH
jgi:hypothetical protein